MTTITAEMEKTDGELAALRSGLARDELARRIDWRQKERMRPAGLLQPHHLKVAPEPTLTMLSDLGIGIADAEIEARRLAGEWKGE
jgi:hypothetical protein